MGKYGKYDDDNLIKYEETIQLHFDRTGTMAWLTLKNYGLVFHKRPGCPEDSWDGVMQITIGIPAGELDENECKDFAARSRMTAPDVRALQPNPTPLNIGVMLDVLQVIDLQVRMVGDPWEPKSVSRSGKKKIVKSKQALLRQDLWKMVESALVDLCPLDLRSYIDKLGPLPAMHDLQDMNKRLRIALGKPPAGVSPGPGALWVSDLIHTNRPEVTGFTAYYPHPRFILQEQRTKLVPADGKPDEPSGTGKTVQEDTRVIKPIASPSGSALLKNVNGDRPFPFEEFFKELDKNRGSTPEEELAFLKSIKTNEHSVNVFLRRRFPAGVAYLHKELDRINCYGFRGDDRAPVALKEGLGFLPGVTRKDPKLAPEFQTEAKNIEDAIQKARDNPKDPQAVNDYVDLMKNLGILTLSVYTLDQNFKGFISTTTSTAIAKCFSNIWAPTDDLFRPTFCYAVRCKGGFHLPSDATIEATQFGEPKWTQGTHAKNAFTYHAEQEVAVPGAIWWEDIVGTRAVRVDKNGPFFAGPVFLSNLLRQEFKDKLLEEWATRPGNPPTTPVEVAPKGPAIPATPAPTGPAIPDAPGPKGVVIEHPAPREPLFYLTPDNGAFDELFELFSGKAQGAGYKIYLSYNELPFDCPDSLSKERIKWGSRRPPARIPAKPEK